MMATAPKQAQPAPTMTDRTLPHPWNLCDVCGKAAGLPDPQHPTFYRCPACAARTALMDTARADLEALTAPVLGAWAAQWTAAGLTLAQAEEVTEQASGAWMHDRAARTFRLTTLRVLARLHRAPAFKRAEPDRLALALEDLPMLEDVRHADHARPWPYFVDGEGKNVDVYAGPDALILTLPNDVRAVLYLGMGGRVEERRASGFRVPPRLWPAVAAALSGPQGVLPSLTGTDVSAGGVTLTLDLYGKSSRYSMTAWAWYTAQKPDAPAQPYRVTFPEVVDRRQVFALTLWVPADLWPAFRAALPHGTVRGPT